MLLSFVPTVNIEYQTAKRQNKICILFNSVLFLGLTTANNEKKQILHMSVP